MDQSALSAEYGPININQAWLPKSCSWSAEQEKRYFPCPSSRLKVWSRGTGSAVPPRASPLILRTRTESDWLMVLTHGIDPAFRDGVHIFIPSTIIGSVPSSPGRTGAYRWRSPPRGRRRRASIVLKGSFLFRFQHGPFIMRLPFFPSTIGMYYSIKSAHTHTQNKNKNKKQKVSEAVPKGI